jgi:hypothetical protein
MSIVRQVRDSERIVAYPELTGSSLSLPNF